MHVTPLLVGWRTAASIGVGVGGPALSPLFSQDFAGSLSEISKTVVTLQNQINSLASVALKNR